MEGSKGNVQNIHYGDVLIKYGSIIDVESDDIPSIAQGKESKGTPYLRDGDVIIADTAEDEAVGKCCEIINVNDAKVESGLHTIPCRPLASFVPMFLGYYMNSQYYHKQLFPLMQGVKVLSISKSNIGKTHFSVPSSHFEQKKIVEMLHLIDLRISKQQHIIEVLKKYKRGVLSVAFDKHGSICSWETTPYPFAVLASRRSEKYDPRSGEQMPCVELEHIEQETGRIIGSIPSTQQSSIKGVCKSGDTLFGKLRPYLRKYAFVKKDMVCSSEIWSLVPSEVIIPEYLFYLVQTDEFIKTANISSGTKMPRAEWSNIEKSVFSVPSKEVQAQIVQTLRELDSRILDAIDMLDGLQFLKRGLMQQIFI